MSARHRRMLRRAPNNDGVHSFAAVFDHDGVRWNIDSVNGLAIWSRATAGGGPVVPFAVDITAMVKVFASLRSATKKPLHRGPLEDHAAADGWCAINGRAFDRNLLRIALDEVKGDLVAAFVPVTNRKKQTAHAFVLDGDNDVLAGIMPGTDLDGVTGTNFRIAGLR